MSEMKTAVDRMRERAETAENKLFAMQGRAVVAEKNVEYLLGRAERAERERDELRRRLNDSCDETRSNIGESPGEGVWSCPVAQAEMVRAEDAERERDQLRALLCELRTLCLRRVDAVADIPGSDAGTFLDIARRIPTAQD